MFGNFWAFMDRTAKELGRKWGEKEGMICSTGPQSGTKPGAAAARTQHLCIWHPRPTELLGHLATFYLRNLKEKFIFFAH